MSKMTTRGHPLWRFDRQRLRETGRGAVVGVDEAGRGAIAGPVVAAAAFFTGATYADAAFRRTSRAINDSKQLTAEERDAQFLLIQSWRADGLIIAAPGVASVEEIEALNILGATRLAMQRALVASEIELSRNDSGEPDDLLGASANDPSCPLMLVDGKPLKPFPWRHEAVVGGDGKSLAIATASIVAKVTRDRLMKELHATDPRFGYDGHKGYGAPRHWEALRTHGPTPHHRSKFLRKFLNGETAAQGNLFDGSE